MCVEDSVLGNDCQGQHNNDEKKEECKEIKRKEGTREGAKLESFTYYDDTTTLI